MSILTERGAFWWNDEPIPSGSLAPASHVMGQLVVSDEGLSHLELDGHLPYDEKNSPMRFVGPDVMLEGKAIRGIIKDKNQHVLLSDLRRNGNTFSNRGISYEKFLADSCLIGHPPFPAGDTFSQLRSMEIDLAGFEPWLGLQSIDYARNRNSTSIRAKYKKPKNLVYSLSDGKLSIRFDINHPALPKDKRHNLTLSELANVHYRFASECTLEEVTENYRRIEEWMILMTNSEHGLDWPVVTVKNKNCRYKLYFWRNRNPAPAPEMFECYPPFPLIRDQLGELFSAWRDKRDKFGSAFALYMASRRGHVIYTENRFTNFVVAIESYHRTKYPPSTEPSKLDKKVQRILGQISVKKDRDWLEGRLKHVEIGLKERITQTLMSLPIDLEKNRCEQFGDACGKRRNDISHYGGRRDSESPYDEFHADLARKNDALSYLLHVLILQELGVAPDILYRFVYQSYRSYPIKRAFVNAGLMDDSVLKPPPFDPA